MSDMAVHRKTPILLFAVCGVLAAVAGMAAGHLVAALVNPASSPVLAVGSTVIDATPTPLKEWAVRTLGNADKPVLLGSVALVTALAAAGIGVLSRRRPTPALVLIVVLAAVAGLAAALRPAALPQDVLPAVVTAVVGAVVLSLLRGMALRATGSAGDEQQPRETPLGHSAYAEGSAGAPARRSFLVGAAAVAVGSGAVGALGQRLGAPAELPSAVSLPRPQNTLAPLPKGLETTVKGIAPFRTPLERFYRVDTALVIPRVDASSWRLEVDGMVDNPFSLTYDELLELPMIEKDITLNCVSNDVGGPYISSTRWLGVRVRDLLERAGVQDGVDQILSESTDGMTISTPIEALLDDRDALIAVGMDGQPLPRPRGFPARMVTPGLYGYVGATKWLAKLTATTYARDQAYWTERDWAEKADVKTQSRIDTPRGLGTSKPGRVAVGGVAWAQRRGIEKVEVRVDDGPWQEAALGPDGGTDYWRQWTWTWEAKSGRHDLTVRATDGTGEVQTAERAEPFPDGASGYHSIVVLVS
jgi:DMSO/TMAO reductase YedYZ molybdopterin-dependent catalytic subunit